MDPTFLQCVGDAVETLCCGIEMRSPSFDNGTLKPLAAAARDRQGGPSPLIAAQKLAGSIGKGDLVVISTGYYLPGPFPKGETDGPPGAASLAYAISEGLGASSLVLAEEQCLEPVRACLEAIGLNEQPVDSVAGKPNSFAVSTFPTDNDPRQLVESRAKELFTSLSPKAVIVLEKAGLNSKGVPHRVVGLPITQGRLRIEALLEKASLHGAITVGIGDRGNEAGLGLVADVCRQYLQYGAVCRCPCQGGVAAAHVCDATVVASVSNWGAYAIAAMLGAVLGTERTIHSPETEEAVIEACARAGSNDGAYYDQRPWVDGIPARIHAHVVDMLQMTIRLALTSEATPAVQAQTSS